MQEGTKKSIMTAATQNPQTRLSEETSVTLIGMAGTGKSTVGRELAAALGLGHVDTDRVIESYFGADLESVFQRLGRQHFLEAEESLVSGLTVRHCVISTGGSVIYGPSAVARLKELGPMVFLRTRLETIQHRLAQAGERGLAIAPGQTLEDLYAERQPLYKDAADFIVDTDEIAPPAVAGAIVRWLNEE